MSYGGCGNLRPKHQPMWNCMCQGCGAPLQVEQVQCSYCLRATGQTVNGARAAMGPSSIVEMPQAPTELR